jgi:hypothetical protein
MARDVYLEGNDDGISRRDFLKKLGYGVGGLFAGGALLDSFSGEAHSEEVVAQKDAEASVPEKRTYLKIAILDFDGGYIKDMKDVEREPVNLDKSIPAMLTSKINGGMIRVVPQGVIKRFLRENGYTMDDFREDPGILAGQIDLDGVITGSYTLVYWNLVINSQYFDMKRGMISETQEVEGGADKLPRLIRDLEREVVLDLSKYYPD